MTVVDFVIPLTPEGLIKSDSISRYSIENEYDISSLSDKEASKKINAISGKLENNPISITQHENFDFLYSCLNDFSSLSISCKSNLIIGLECGLKGMQKYSNSLLKQSPESYRQNLPTCRNGFKMYLYLIHWFVSKEGNSSTPTTTTGRGKKKKSDNQDQVWSSDSQKEQLIAVLVNCLESDLTKIWNNMKPEEDFLNLFSKIGRIMLESPSNVKSKSLKRSIFTMLSLLIHRFEQSQTVSACIMELLFKYEHLAAATAEFLEQFVKDFKSTQIIGEFIREISRMEALMSRDASGTKNISTFIVSLSEILTKELIPNMSLLIPLLANDSYMLRNGIIQAIGSIVCISKDADESEKDNTKHRDQYLEILEGRVTDVASYTRSKALQTLISIVQQKKLPLKFISSVTEAAIGRLEDRTTQVRKYSIQLLTNLLLFNPFSPNLKLSDFCSQLEAIDHQIKGYNSTKTAKPQNNEEFSDEESEEEESDEKLRKLIRQKKFLEDAIVFINKIHQCINFLVILLGSKTTTDVQESIDFFVTATGFKIEPAFDGVKRMLTLVYSKEQGIKEAVINAYNQLYLSLPPQFDPKLGDVYIASNLVKLATGASTSELTCLDELIAIFTSKQIITSGVIKCLWDFFAMKVPNITELQSKGALIILSMSARSNPEIVKERIKLLVSIGLGPRYKQDEEIAKYACIALQKLSLSKDESDKKTKQKRIPATHSLFERLSIVIKEDSNSTSKWFPAAEQAINAIYILAENPDSICTPIIKYLANQVFNAPPQSDEMTNDDNDMDSESCTSDRLSRFLFVIGHVALKHMQYLEEIQIELARRKNILENTAQNNEKKKKGKEQTLEEELGVGAVADDTDEFIQLVTEKEIVQKNLLGSFSPLIIAVCINEGNQFQSHLVRSSAVIALCKFMCVSTEFCESHLSLLFTLLAKASESWIRSDIVIALGDLVTRFPNQIDVWIPKIFPTLRDKEPSVRKNALMVLSHLILNEMVKVKGYISEIALCIEDSDERISDLAKLFFNEFNNKDGGNIYNILPDMISNLSVSECSSENFRNIMKYVLAFIDKEKQTESLIDRLCQQRLRAATNISQVADIVYCMSLLNYSEKGFKKIAENYKYYQDKLMDDSVYNYFIQIIQKAKKNSKSEMKIEIEDFENKVNAQHQGTVEESDAMVVDDEENLNPQLSKAKPAIKKRAATSRATKAAGKSKVATKAAPPKRKPPTRAVQRRKIAYDDDDDDWGSD